MKRLLNIILFLSIFFACNEFDIEDQGFNLEPFPESVSFNAPGDTYELDEEVAEGTSVTIEVEAPNGTLDDIVVSYELSGSATFGVDYTIAGATSSGGTVSIVHDPSDVINFDHGDILIEALLDTESESAETIIITLVGAVRGSESIEVGRGGTDFGKSATITIPAD